jgi:hypothetical protein
VRENCLRFSSLHFFGKVGFGLRVGTGGACWVAGVGGGADRVAVRVQELAPGLPPQASKADKRAHHNALERKRRDHIKDSFTVLRDSIPNIAGEKVC